MSRSYAVIAALTLSLALTGSVGPATAAFGPNCNEPDPPWCLNDNLKTEYAFNNCRSEMERYVDRVDSYVDCLERAKRAAVKESNDAVRRFNCKAKGDSFCF